MGVILGGFSQSNHLFFGGVFCTAQCLKSVAPNPPPPTWLALPHTCLAPPPHPPGSFPPPSSAMQQGYGPAYCTLQSFP
jgi:hypothetical protein